MSLLPTIGAVDQDTDFYNGVIGQSLRIDNSASALLHRTPSAGDRKTWVWSAWIKRCDEGRTQDLFCAEGSGNQLFEIQIIGNDRIQIYGNDAVLLIASPQLRDLSSWYHILVASDTTQTTASNRLKLYINGSEVTSFETDARSSYTGDTDFGINSNVKHNIGSNQAGGNFGDFYIAEVNFIDGLSFFSNTSGAANSSFNINSFGETKNGVWIPIAYTGSYGTQGFHLEFKQTGDGSSTAGTGTIGADTANSNHYRDTNLDTYDSNMPDSPENNFAVLNPLDQTTATLSEGNLKIVSPGNIGANATYKMSSGKWYAEFYIDNSGSRTVEAHVIVGDIDFVANFTGTVGSFVAYRADGDINGTAGNATFTTGDIIAVAIDADNGAVAWYKNNAVQSTTVSSLTYTAFCPAIVNFNGSGAFAVANFGQDGSFAGTLTGGDIGTATDGNGHGKFKYAPPSGYLALCSANLPEPTIGANSTTQAGDYFNTVLYEGTGYDSDGTYTQLGQDVVVGFKPDWVWIKNRDKSNHNHSLFDSNRGATKRLISNLSNAEGTEGTALTDFDVTGGGFTLGVNNEVNENDDNFVSWNWKANGGTTSTISVGDVSTGVPSIASTVQVNATAGFSIVTFTGNGSDDATIGHGLGTTPAMIFTKNRDEAQQWRVHHKELPTNYVLYLAENYAQIATNGSSNGYIKTVGSSTYSTHASNVDSLGVNGSGDKMVSYCFAEIEGYSKFGKYIGNDDTDGTFVYTGFRPAWVMLKRIDSADDWFIHDSTRDTFNINGHLLYANEPNAEYDAIAAGDADNSPHDFYSNGFKLRSSNANWNGDGAAYIYMAFAEAPFKYANAR